MPELTIGYQVSALESKIAAVEKLRDKLNETDSRAAKYQGVVLDALKADLKALEELQKTDVSHIEDTGEKISKVISDIEKAEKKSYEKGTEYLLAEKKKQLAIYTQYEGRKPEYVAQLQSEIAALEKKANASSIAEHKKATAAYKKELDEQKSAVESFNEEHKKATLSTFDYEIDKLDEWYNEQNTLVEKGLISRQDLEETYADKWFEIYDDDVSDFVDAQQEKTDAVEKEKEEILKLEKESQEMRYNMLKDLGGSGYYDEQIKAIEDYAQKYIDLTQDIVTAEAWKNNEIQKADRIVTGKQIGRAHV